MKKILIGLMIVGISIGGYQVINLKNNEEKKNIEKVDENKPPVNVEIELEDKKDYLAKDFTLLDLKGNEVSLSSLKGKNIMLNFWATWCPPCKEEMGAIEKLYEESKDDKDFEIITVNVGENENKVKDFIYENKYTFKVLLDLEGEVSMQYKTFVLPTTFYIDDEGYMRKEVKGAMSYSIMKEYKENLINDGF